MKHKVRRAIKPSDELYGPVLRISQPEQMLFLCGAVLGNIAFGFFFFLTSSLLKTEGAREEERKTERGS